MKFYGNQYRTKLAIRIKELLRKLVLLIGAVAGTVAMFYILQYYHGVDGTISAVNEVFSEVVEELPPVMQRIAQCESGDSHYDSTGQITTNGNKNGTVDIGRFQINLYYWAEEATELDYDLTDEDDNTAFAMYLYHNQGTEAWVWSKKCWQ